jgi:hypothetical protein
MENINDIYLEVIEKTFPNYNDDVCFGGDKKLVKISFITENMESTASTSYYIITCNYIDGLDIVNESMDTYYDFAETGQKYFDKLIKDGILKNEKIYNFNDKKVLKLFDKYKKKINNCVFNNEEIMSNREILAQDTLYDTIGKIIFSDTIINNMYYTDAHYITKKSFDLYTEQGDLNKCRISFIKLNNRYIDVAYFRQYFPYVVDIRNNNDAYIMNREYESFI